jgi:YidC/Oxa1 family membrane protein insertase
MLQTILLRVPAIRRTLKIPIIPAELQGKLPRLRDTFQRIRAYFTSDLKERVEKARREAIVKERMNRTRRW